MTPCRLVNIHGRFERSYCFHLQVNAVLMEFNGTLMYVIVNGVELLGA